MNKPTSDITKARVLQARMDKLALLMRQGAQDTRSRADKRYARLRAVAEHITFGDKPKPDHKAEQRAAKEQKRLAIEARRARVLG